MRSSQSKPNQWTVSMMESTYSCSSFSGLVSSKRRLVLPPNSAARPKFRQIDLAWPRCRYPFGSGGKRVWTCPWYLLVLRSSRTISRTKFVGRAGSSGVATLGLGFDSVIHRVTLYLTIEGPLLRCSRPHSFYAPHPPGEDERGELRWPRQPD